MEQDRLVNTCQTAQDNYSMREKKKDYISMMMMCRFQTRSSFAFSSFLLTSNKIDLVKKNLIYVRIAERHTAVVNNGQIPMCSAFSLSSFHLDSVTHI